ncbi:hypothetical protein N7513_003474 [Penicillium frequentans]|uniref:Uncharacterized protein n=1 Tax=Penicillium frequentans TaxID=3151616 RepID=A0AAD6CZY3_9EURO|nr:hypothetical protein N7494_005223 [Penicillium glabrum]KAJ5556046.1 hypothetical protein N7513_003688 [Penicillium glabrum]KAJ5557888.1 hypothetical protein N7513_003474 [Penicillium glabrum]
MEPQPLHDADEIRKEIKSLLPQVTTLEQDATGNKKYGGDALLALISRMKTALGIDEAWEGRVRYWSKATKLDLPNSAYLIPILKGIEVNGWLLKEGWFVQVNVDPVVGAGTTTLIVAPH